MKCYSACVMRQNSNGTCDGSQILIGIIIPLKTYMYMYSDMHAFGWLKVDLIKTLWLIK